MRNRKKKATQAEISRAIAGIVEPALQEQIKKIITGKKDPSRKEMTAAVDEFNGEVGRGDGLKFPEHPLSPAEQCVAGVRFHQKIDSAVVIRRIEEQAQRQLKSQASFLYEDFQRTERRMNGKIFRLEEALRQSHRRHAEDLIAWAGEGRRNDTAGMVEKIREFDVDTKAGFNVFDPGYAGHR